MRRLLAPLFIAAVLGTAAFFISTHPKAYTALRGDSALEPTRARDVENGKTLFNAGGLLNVGANGIMNYTLPNGATGRAIDNGNGTVTLIGADGQVMTVPASR